MPELTDKQQALLDELLKDFKGDARDIFGEGGLLKTIGKRALEAALEGELTHHLGYPPHDRSGRGSGNSRNGRTAKRLESESGSLDLEVPRDRNGSFEPKIVEKRQRRVAGLDDVIVYLYAQGQSTRAIQDTLKRLYGAEVSSTLVSEVTASVLEEVTAWQARPLERVYPIVYFDALFVKSREEGSVKTRAVYVALAIDIEGEKKVLGLWIAPTEGAVSWLTIFGELKARGMEDCFIACVDGLKGLPEAIETVFPRARVQLCVVHQVRKSLRVRTLEGAQAGGVVFARGLRSAERRGRSRGARGFRETMEREVPGYRSAVEEGLGASGAFLRLCACDPQGGLHHQCDRIAELQPAQNRQGAGRFPQRRSGAQAALPGPARSREEMEATHTRLEGCPQPVRHTLWRQSPHRSINSLTQLCGHAPRRVFIFHELRNSSFNQPYNTTADKGKAAKNLC